jgi:cytochrome c551
MFTKFSAVLLTFFLILLLTACGSDKPSESSTSPTVSPITESPTDSPIVESSESIEPSATPQASIEASQAPAATEAIETSTPKATPTATPKAIATATAKPTIKPTIKPTATPQAPDTSGAAAEALFKMNCTSCHGVDLGGNIGPNLQNIGGSLTKAQITNQITNGGDEMPSFGKSLKAEEIQTLAAWLAAKK